MVMSTPLKWHECDKSLAEFEYFLQTITYSERNPLNTEAFYLWCMVRRDQPLQFIESGTFKGYSANFLCEALSRNSNSPSFTTIGFDLENCLVTARERLAPYPFAKVIEGDSFNVIGQIQGKSLPTAFFIDGPKGKNLRPFLQKLFTLYPNIVFVAIHDSEEESGSGNRKIAMSYADSCDIFFCGAEFQERYRHLDEPLLDVMPEDLWRPYWLKGKATKSYGTETAFIVPDPTRSAVHATGKSAGRGGRLKAAFSKLKRAIGSESK